jgi:predicted outer membrane repeat protein
MRRSNLLFSIALTGILFIVPSNARSANPDVCRSGCRYSTIQSAIDATKDRGTVLVGRGDYRENIIFPNRQITVRSIDGPQVTWIRGIRSNQHTVSYNPGKKHRVLQGFRVSGGKKGGMRIEGNGAVINCQIVNNEGPGIEIRGGTPGIYNTTINSNRASNGGGIFIERATVTIIGSTIRRNRASSYGGGIFAGSATVNLVSSAIQENQKDGIKLDKSQAYIQKSKIINNRDGRAGGIAMYDSRLIMLRSVISENSGRSGGAIYSQGNSKLTMTNCTFANNVGGMVGGIRVDSSKGYDSVIANCTVVSNAAESSDSRATGGISFMGTGGQLQVINSIVGWNTAQKSSNQSHRDLYKAGSGALTLDYSCVDYAGGVYWPLNVIKCGWPVDFVGSGDYHLKLGSKFIDAGTSDKAKYPMIPNYDIDGDRRPQGSRHDMGSDEFVGTH